MPDRLINAALVSAVLLSMLIWPAIDKLRDWLDRRGCVGLDLDEVER